MSKINIKFFLCFKGGFEIYDLKEFLIKYLMAVLLSFWNRYTFGPWQAVWAVFQPALHIHFAQSVTSMRQKEIIHVFTGNRKLGEYMLFGTSLSLHLAHLIVFLHFFLCLLFVLFSWAVPNAKLWVNCWQASHSSKLSSCPTIRTTPKKAFLVLHWFGNIISPISATSALWHI